MSRQVTDQLYIELDYYYPEDYYTYTAEAAAAVSAAASISCNVSKIVEASVTLSSEFTQNTIGSRFQDIDLYAFSEAALNAVNERLRQSQADVSTVFDIATDVFRLRSFASDEAAEFAISSAIERIRGTDSTVSAAFSLAAAGEIVKETTVSITSEFTQNCDAERIPGAVEADAALQSEFTQSTTVERVRDSAVSITASFESTINAERLRSSTVSVSSDTAVTAAVGKILDFVISEVTLFDCGLSITVVKNTFAVLDSTATLAGTATRTRNVQSQITSEVTVSSSAERTRDFASALSSSSNLQASGTYLRNAAASLTSLATASVTARTLSRYVQAELTSGTRYRSPYIDNTASKWGSASLNFGLSTSQQIRPTSNPVWNGTNFRLFAAGYTWTSTDGQSWTRASNNLDTNSITQWIWVNNQYVGRTNKSFYTSSNGTTFTKVTATIGYNVPESHIGFLNGFYYILGRSTSNANFYLIRSSDLTNWSMTQSDVFAGFTAHTVVDTVVNTGSTLVFAAYKTDSSTGTEYSYTFSVNTSGTMTRANYLLNQNNIHIIGLSFGGSTYVAWQNNGTLRRATTLGTWTTVSGLTFGQPTGSNISYKNSTWLVQDYNRILSGSSIDSLTERYSISKLDSQPGYLPTVFEFGSSRYVTEFNGQSLNSSNLTAWSLNEITGVENLPGYVKYSRGDNSEFSTIGTIDFWMKEDGTNNLHYIVKQEEYNSTHDNVKYFWIYFDSGSNILYLQSRNDSGSTASITYNVGSSTSWRHVRVSISGSNASLFVDGSRVATTASWVAPGFNSPLVVGYSSFTDSGTFRIDELYVSDAVITSTAATTYTVPTAAWFNNSTDIDLLAHYDVNVEDDTSVIQTATAAISSTADLSATATVTKSTVAAVNAAATISATASRQISASATLSTQGFVVAAVVKKIDEVAVLSTTATLTVTVTKIEAFTVAVSSQASVTAQVTRIKRSAVAISGAFAATVTAKQFEGIAALTLTAPATVTVKGTYTNGTLRSTISSQTTVAAQGREIIKDPVPVALSNRHLYHLNAKQASGWLEEYTQTYVNLGGSEYTDLGYNNETPSKFGLDSGRSLYTPYGGSYGVSGTPADSNTIGGVSFPISGLSDFTIDLWLSPYENTGTVTPREIFKVFFYDGFDSVYGYRLTYGASDSTGNLTMTLRGFSSESSAATIPGFASRGPIPGTGRDPYRSLNWYHVALQRSGTQVTLWVNGSQVAALTETNNLGSYSRYRLTGNIRWGWVYSSDQQAAKQVIDEIRIIPSAVYSTTFTPPTQEYAVEYYTVKYGDAWIEPKFTLGILITQNAEADLTSTSTVTATVRRIKSFSSALTTAFTQTTQATRTRSAVAALNSQTTVSGSAVKFRQFASSITSQSTLAAQATRIQTASAALSTAVSMTAAVSRTRNTGSSLSTTVNQTATVTRIRSGASNFSAFYTQLAVTAINATGTVLMESQAQVTAQVIKTTGINENLNVTTALTAINDRFRSTAVSVNSNSELTCDYINIKPAGSNMSAVVSVSINTDNSRIVGITANNTSKFTQTTVNDTLRFASGTLASQTNITAVAYRTKFTSAALNSNSDFYCLPGVIVYGQANLPSIATQLTIGDVLQIDPFYQIKVPMETRQGTVLPESRVIQVEQETRVNILI